MKLEFIVAALSVPVIGGVVFTRIRFKHRQRGVIASRLARWQSQTATSEVPVSLLKNPERFANKTFQFKLNWPGFDVLHDQLNALQDLVIEAGMEEQFSAIVLVATGLFCLPILLAFALEANLWLSALAGLILAALPLCFLKARAEARRTKFCEQLPDAIDLMVAVLRSGHSVAQAVKAVADEVPDPCGEEFSAILNRMNLGQPLSESLVYSARRFRSYELDLIRRAVAIQAEVGGSLSDLLDKTNYTLRERLKLKRQLKIITSQSRLSAWIVGLLPLFLAVVLNMMSPGYLQLLTQDKMGQGLLCAVIILEVAGIYVMRRMSTMRV